MAEYEQLAKRMEEGTVVKAVIGPYVIYKRAWLHENLDAEYELQKRIKALSDKKPKDGITRLREFLELRKMQKIAEKQGF